MRRSSCSSSLCRALTISFQGWLLQMLWEQLQCGAALVQLSLLLLLLSTTPLLLVMSTTTLMLFSIKCLMK
jgi:hypothetical protein